MLGVRKVEGFACKVCIGFRCVLLVKDCRLGFLFKRLQLSVLKLLLGANFLQSP